MNFGKYKKNKIRSIAAFVLSAVFMFGAVSSSSLVFAEPSSSPEPSPKATASSASSKSTAKPDKNEDDSDDGEAEASPSPTKNPRVDDDGRPVLSENECAVLVDSRTGEVFFEQNSDKRVYPASTTKIMTALLVLEAVERDEVNLNSAFLITADMLEDLPVDGSSMNLKEGEAMTVQQLMEGLLIESGNDAAQALAVIVCGDISTFVQRMNDRAEVLGLSDTHFTNVHGLHDDEHYTTAKDLSIITREAMKNKTFRSIVAMSRVSIPATDKTAARTMINTNGLLSKIKYTDYYYHNAIGVKTGHTGQAGFCLVSAAQKGDFEVVAVLLNASTDDDRHYDSRNMLAYAIDNHKSMTPIKRDDILTEIKVRFGTGNDHTTLSVSDDVKVTVPEDTKDEDLEIIYNIPSYIAAPVNEGDKVGTVEIMLSGKVVGSGDLFADMTVKRHPLGFLMQFFAFIWSFTAVKVIVFVIIALIIIFVLYMVINIRRNLKQAKINRSRSRRRPPRNTGR